jgi:hypothetical protein
MSNLVVDGKTIRRDGEMWCMTDLWRASGAPNGNRPANWLRKEGASFVEFLAASSSVPGGHIRKKPGNPGAGEPSTMWAHWQVSLAYAKSLSHAFHARVNEVYQAFTAGRLVPRAVDSDHEELVRLTLRIHALHQSEYATIWDRELKVELARLRKLAWDGHGRQPQPLALAYGRTLRIVLGDKVYEELKARNPSPGGWDGTVHGRWLTDDRAKMARREDLVIALVFARRSRTWAEYEREMRSHFRRTPIQLRLGTGT